MTGYLIAFACILGLYGFAHGVRALRNRRRRGKFHDGGLVRDGELRDVPHVLSKLGLVNALRDGYDIVGAYGEIDGVAVEAVELTVAGRNAWAPSALVEGTNPELRYLVAISLAPLTPRVTIEQRSAIRHGDIVLGDDAFDSYFALVGDRDVAVTCLDAKSRAMLRAAFESGWRIDGQRLVRSETRDEYVADFLESGLAAARAMQVGDERERLKWILATDRAVRMRRRAMLVLVTRYPGEAELAHRNSEDLVLRLLAAWRDDDWLDLARAALAQRTGIVEIAEALAERTEPAAYALVAELLRETFDDEDRAALEAARDRLRVKTVASAGTLSVADQDVGGLTLEASDLDPEPSRARVVETEQA